MTNPAGYVNSRAGMFPETAQYEAKFHNAQSDIDDMTASLYLHNESICSLIWNRGRIPGRQHG